ncbi:MAG TPA: hypothetical protein VLW50_19335 [Streptosporangiaceae bacterium]|nr:hypothetical protein [Streptosporangiaceae bacterium]
MIFAVVRKVTSQVFREEVSTVPAPPVPSAMVTSSVTVPSSASPTAPRTGANPAEQLVLAAQPFDERHQLLAGPAGDPDLCPVPAGRRILSGS